jgi:hypothetical protein
VNVSVPAVPREISKRALLLGEGVDEINFFSALLKHLGITNVQVEQYGGKDGLRPYLGALKSRPGFGGLRAIGVTRDVDGDSRAATASVTDSIQAAQFPAEVSVHYFLLPKNDTAGALEDLCLSSIAGTELDRCIEAYFACAADLSDRSFETPALRAKARIHVWLARRTRPIYVLATQRNKD